MHSRGLHQSLRKGFRDFYGILFVFFFQAEDGIRDLTVTGVQTCALPISPGFTIETSVSAEYSGGTNLDGLKSEVAQALERVEEAAGRGFGDAANPLLVSVDRKSVV